ncbi:MAG: hypothetical protein V3V03_09320 [Hyphomonadaceae bacterium]
MLSYLRRLPIWRALPLVLLFALAFTVVAVTLSLMLRARSPAPDMLTLSPKLTHYQSHAAEYDTVFIGTSRTLYHIVPARFEEGALAAGCPDLKAFNFGVHGLNGTEEDWLIDQVMTAGAGHLQNIVLEDPLPEAREFPQATSERARYFHGPDQYGSILSSIWSFPEIKPKHVFRTGVFAVGAGYDLSGIGRASGLVFPDPDQSDVFVMDLTEDGFEALDEVTSDGIVARRELFLEGADEFANIISAYDPHASVPNLEARVDYNLAQLQRIEAAGIRTAFYVSPDPMELGRTPLVGKGIAAREPTRTVLNYNQPDFYPHLFERAIWQDFSHYSRIGAETLSFEIGRDLCEQAGWGPE